MRFLASLAVISLAASALAQTPSDPSLASNDTHASSGFTPATGSYLANWHDNFNRADAPTLGADWTTVGAPDAAIVSSHGRSTGVTATQWTQHNFASVGYKQARQTVDILPLAGAHFVACIFGAGGTDTVFLKVQSNTGTGMLDNVGFYQGINGGAWAGGAGFLPLAIPTMQARMTCYFTNNGDTAHIDLDHNFDGIPEESLVSNGLLGSGLVINGTGMGLGFWNQADFDNWGGGDAAVGWVFEDFEHGNLGLYTATGAGGSTTINAPSMHDGALGTQFAGGSSPWYYRTDFTFGPGTKSRCFVRNTGGSGRAYVGFAADAGGCWSAVISTNTNQLILQENAGYLFTDRATVPFVFAVGTWYQVEVAWALNGDVRVNLYNESGTALLTSTPSFAAGLLTAKGYSMRGFDSGGTLDIDTRTVTEVAPPTGWVFENFEHGNLGLYTATGAGGSTTINPASAHDGVLGTGFAAGVSPWYYRTDFTFGPGTKSRCFVRNTGGSGRAYVGFAADAGGCWSAVISTNTNELILQENAGYLFTDRSAVAFVFGVGTWYQLEVAWALDGDVTVNLYNESGTTLLASTPTYAAGLLTSKGYSMRGFNNGGTLDIDTRSLSGGLPPPFSYCVPKTTSNLCLPSIGSAGVPSATAGAGFFVNGTNFINNKNCLLFYGVTGQAAAPFQGGTLCVSAPIRRTPGTNTLGNPPPNDCSGVPAIDMNKFAVGALGGTPLPALTQPGTVVNCQWWGRDPGFAAPNNTQLSNGLQYVVGS